MAKELVIGWTPGPWVLQCDFTEKEHTAGSISNFYIYLPLHDFFLPQALKDQKYKGENDQPHHQWPSMQLERLQSWGFFFFFKLHVEYSFLYSCPLLNFSVSNGVYYFLKGVLLEITHLFTYWELHRSFIQASSVRFLFPLYHKPWRAGAMSFLCPSISKVEHMACCSMKTLQLRTEWMNEWASDWINEWHHNCHWMNNWMMSNLRQAICWIPKKQKWRPSSALELLHFHHSV